MADNAGSAADATKITRETASESGRIVHQAISEIGNISDQANASSNSMTDLKQHTHEVSRFAKEIKEISKQTNLLSLNAAIEPARAGEAGRGLRSSPMRSENSPITLPKRPARSKTWSPS